MMNFDESQILNLVRSRLVEHFRPVRIILFGSRSRGQARPDSDLDLLVVLSDAPDKRALAIQMRRLLNDLPIGKDILVTTPEEIDQRGDLIGTVLRPALREGKVLFARE
jgi:predicted nucleotidyltransferase